MASLKERLYHTIPTGDAGESISGHAFYAAARQLAAGAITAAEFKAVFDITDAEYDVLVAVVAAKTAPFVYDVLVLAEAGYYTPAQADSRLGI